MRKWGSLIGLLKGIAIACAALCAALPPIGAVAEAATGTVLYSQPTNAFPGYISQNSTGWGVPATAYDNFTLAVDASVNEITWVGELVYGTPSVLSFTLQIYTDNSGTPGTSIFSTTVTTFNQTPLGLDLYGYPYISYDATGFSTPRLTAGTKYWLSIVATTTPPAPPYWDWEFGTGGDGSFFYAPPVGTSGFLGADLAFTLYGGPLYDVRMLYDPTKAFKSGSTIPIKLELCDGNGGNLSSPNVVVTATVLTRMSDSASELVQDSGNANPDNNFRYDPTLGGTGGYIFNMSTKGLASGTYQLSFTAGSDLTVHSVQFQVK